MLAMLAIGPLVVSAGGVEVAWTAEDVLAALAAHDAAVKTIDVTFMIVEGPSDQTKELYRARRQAAEMIARVTGETLPPPQPDPNFGFSTTFRRVARNEQGQERMEVLKSDGQKPGDVLITTVFDGKEWRTLEAQGGTIHSEKDADWTLDYLGLGFRSREPGEQSNRRLLHEVLQEKHSQGRLFVDSVGAGEDSALVVISTRDPVATEVLRDKGVVTQHKLWLDPRMGMAPVRMEIKTIYPGPSGEFLETVPGGTRVAQWLDYQRTGDVWLPRKWKYTVTEGVVFPKNGVDYPKNTDFKNAKAEDFSEKRFESLQINVTTLKMAVNEPLPSGLFRLDFPPGTLVFNRVTRKAYQVTNSGEWVRAALADAPDTLDDGLPYWRIALITINAVLVAGIVLFLAVRRFRHRVA